MPEPSTTEIVNEMPGEMHRMPVRCHFSAANTLESPCFWILIGALGTLAALYMLNRAKKLS